MKKIKSVVAILMVLVLAFGMLAGCKSDVPETVTAPVNVGAKYITYCRAKKVEVITKKPFFAALDGEVFETTHLVAEIKEGALNFAAPSEKVKVNV